MNRFRLAAGLLALSFAVLGAPAVSAGPRMSFDYTKIKGLSPYVYETTRDVYDVPMRDGVTLHLEVERPDAPGRFGTILKLSPYHGRFGEDRQGGNILPPEYLGLTNEFAPRGYAVAFADLRGTGLSQGCLDYMGPKDQKDAYDLVEWIARRSWSNGRVGMIGISYPGSTPIFTAAQRPPHLTTIVPIAGLARMYDHEFQIGVPYSLQWVGPAGSYEEYTVERHLAKPTATGPYAGCGVTQSAGTTGEAYVSGQETAWHRERDFRKAASNPLPVFLVHGVDDGAVRTPTLEWFAGRRRATDKVWIGQWGHQRPPRDDQWVGALHAWFDRHLQGRSVPTGPRVELFLNDEESVYESPVWPVKPKRSLVLDALDGGTLGTGSGETSTVRYVADGRGWREEFETGNVAFDSDPVSVDTLIAGVPTLRLSVSVTSPRVHLIGTLYDVAPSGRVDRIGQGAFAIQPEFRNGIDKPAPVTPGQVMTMTVPGMVQAHLLRRGHHLRLVLASSHPDKAPTFGSGAVVDVVVGGGKTGTRLVVPVIQRPTLLRDVFAS